MKRQAKKIISTKIEANKDKLYRMSDIFDLSMIVFPNKNATDLRAAFILIFLTIKYSQTKNVTSSDIERVRQQKTPELSLKSLWKARATMARLGLIARRDTIYWTFSSKWSTSLNNLAEKTSHFIVPIRSNAQEEKEWYLLEYANAAASLKKQSCR